MGFINQLITGRPHIVDGMLSILVEKLEDYMGTYENILGTYC